MEVYNMRGTLTYWVPEGQNRLRLLKLTVCAEDGEQECGVAELRRRRISRILSEALEQGARLSYRDLSMIMLTSKATLKRDVSLLREQGVEIPLGGNGKAA
jgi:hypothetical protein